MSAGARQHQMWHAPLVSANGNWKQTVVSVPAGNNMVKSIIIYTEKEKKKGDLGFSLINYISNDGSSAGAPTKTDRSWTGSRKSNECRSFVTWINPIRQSLKSKHVCRDENPLLPQLPLSGWP